MNLINSCLVTVILASLLSLHECYYSYQELAPIPSKNFVKLTSQSINSTSANVKRNHTSDLYTRQGDIQHNQKKLLFEKTCIGTSNRMSAQHNKTYHYQHLIERYRNCTYVIGNLEITWLERGQDGKAIDLTFLESIREITGYLLIASNKVDRISMPNLQIIRGRDLFRLNSGQKEEFAMFLFDNQLKTLELPNLREILIGNVGIYDNRNLCHIRSISWDEILNTPMYRPVFSYNGSEPLLDDKECPPCHSSCNSGSCWGPGPDMCQKFSKINCSPQCSLGRCYGQEPRECCHLFCAGGCAGPKQTDCFACKHFYNDGECIQECPSMQRYNPSLFNWEPNPNGKYSFGANCVKECPEHLLRDNGACVRTCPPNKRSVNGECVPCSGPCPKNCQGVETLNSKNIEEFINCTTIEGSITILDSTFTGYADFYSIGSNHTIGIKYEPMHPRMLDVFKTVKEITGFLNIQANHSDFKDLSCFSNLQTITGRQQTELSSSLCIIKSSLVSLNLRQLKKVRAGKVIIEENRDLCFVDTIDWRLIYGKDLTQAEKNSLRGNANPERCQQLGLQCHEQCAKDGCWGPGPDECLSCKNYSLDDDCVANCSSKGGSPLSYDAGRHICKRCHPECKGGCSSGDQANNCWQCKNVKDGPYCVAECPSHKYNKNGTCAECDRSCTNGCTGPSNRLGEGGCNSCGKAIINSTDLSQVFGVEAHCIRADEPCPEGYYQEYVSPHAEGPLKLSAGKPVCRKCHNRCKSCTGMGSHVSVCECAKYTAGEQCEDLCPRDYFADEPTRQCIKCSPECNGCTGPTEADCISCRVYRIYYEATGPQQQQMAALINRAASIRTRATSISSSESSDQEPSVVTKQTKFNCTAQCPPYKPYRISESNMLDPYCSEDPGNDAENPRILSLSGTWVLCIIIILASIIICTFIHRCQIEKDKTMELTKHLSGIINGEPLEPSNMKPNLALLVIIKETELRKGKKLGEGFGGSVYEGFWYPEDQKRNKKQPVAIKVLRDNGQSNKDFLNEAYMMASVQHQNLVRLLAVCMTPSHLMLVTQLMPLGCLLDYVRKYKNHIDSKTLLEWSKQIAQGMSYLESMRLVHRDLALRNVLLQAPGHALISDFGLAKFLDIDQSEYQSGGGKLPIKWLAPECIRERKFTHKSDVWAFGVTVWELLTFGQRPFEEYETKDVPVQIEKGARLQQPSYVTVDVYKVMLACWFYNPDDRPDFVSLTKHFVNFARDPGRYLICGAKGDTLRSLSGGARMDKMDGNNSNQLNTSDLDNDEVYNSSDNLTNEDEEEEEPPNTAMSILPDLTPTQFGASHHLTPTPSNSGHRFFFHNQQQLIGDEQVFVDAPSSPATMSREHLAAQKAKNSSVNHLIATDANNNNFVQNNNCWHTMSTNSLGQKSEQPTDPDDYLLPSPCSNEAKFSKFLASYEGTSSRLPPAPAFTRDPPHSAGPFGVSNEEYFMTRVNYVNSSGHRETNASTGHIPSSLV